jgi:hypothetical protein
MGSRLVRVWFGVVEIRVLITFITYIYNFYTTLCDPGMTAG